MIRFLVAIKKPQMFVHCDLVMLLTTKCPLCCHRNIQLQMEQGLFTSWATSVNSQGVKLDPKGSLFAWNWKISCCLTGSVHQNSSLQISDRGIKGEGGRVHSTGRDVIPCLLVYESHNVCTCILMVRALWNMSWTVTLIHSSCHLRIFFQTIHQMYLQMALAHGKIDAAHKIALN